MTGSMTVTFTQLPDKGGVRIVVPSIPGFARVAHGPHQIARALEDAWTERDCYTYARTHGETYDLTDDTRYATTAEQVAILAGRHGICADCADPFPVRATGRMPNRCPGCTAHHKALVERDRSRDRRAVKVA